MLNDTNNNCLSDVLSLVGIYLSLKNLELNLTQSDKQEILDDLDDKTNHILTLIEKHLADQDELLKSIGECVIHDDSRNISKD